MQSVLKRSKRKTYGFSLGIGITLIISLIAKYIAQFPFLNIMGQLVLAILLGIGWKAIIGISSEAIRGTDFSSKVLLRLGIILLGARLNIMDIIHTGPAIIVVAVVHILFTLFAVYTLSRFFHVNKNLSILLACGTAICGAAAVVAIAQQIKAKDDETAIGAATVAILGTIFTLLYIAMYPLLHLSAHGYGVFTGATLHEIAHVIAAAAVGGNEAVDIAVIVKLTRVALLIPVAIGISIWMDNTTSLRNKVSLKSLPIPWFIVGFMLMSIIHSLGILSASIINVILLISYMLIGMAMAGLGLTVSISAYKKLGLPSFASGLVGSVLLSLLGFGLIHALHLN